ncbi:hypothetical protein WOLCODRAFT_45468, partial [Wolfiporia cocos MD-104 SS10]
PTTQRGMRGNIIIHPQRPENLATILPLPVADIITPICVIFVGSSPPSREWLRTKAKPLIVRREMVRCALVWLKENNPLYAEVQIDHSAVDALPTHDILPVHVEHVLPSEAQESLTSHYDPSYNPVPHDTPNSEPTTAEVPFHNIVVTDVDAHAPSHELRAAALRHVKAKGGGYLRMPHDPQPVNEFCNPSLFPMMYPTLFPFGVGGFEDPSRSRPLSFKRHVKHL